MDIRTPTVKRGELGLAGSLIVLAQVLSSYQSTSSVSSDIQGLRSDIEDIRKDQGLYFVKKDDLRSVQSKISKINDQLTEIKKQIRALRSDYAFLPAEPEIECKKGGSNVSLI